MHFLNTFAIGLVTIVTILAVSFVTAHLALGKSAGTPLSGPQKILMGMFMWTVIGGVVGLVYCMGLFAVLLVGK